MRTKHIFVASLDAGELLPFAVRKKKTVQENIQEQERAKKELIKFIDRLEKNYNDSIYYMGMDLIEAKNYERFMFEKGGFFEVMVESPLAMNAHFVHRKRAETFCNALKKTLRSMLRKDKVTEMFVDSIEVNSEQDQSLTYEKWSKLKAI
ncbi:hypothetical protein KY347_01605 [Candidatus Woesearchaeota archaeon]|nr:hypothetical protein [Candidatus Woesearchaeota archaeon]